MSAAHLMWGYVDGQAIVTQAPERIQVTGDLMRGAAPKTVTIVEQGTDTFLVTGSSGFGEGRVAYRVAEHVEDTPDLYVLDRIA